MKISSANMDKIMERCTKKEIDLILYIGQFQDDAGIINGIDYKDVLSNIRISKSTFYKLLYGLEHKGIIEINYLNTDYGYWEVTILDNVFRNQEDYKKGYLNLNYEVLHSKAFLNFTKAEKVFIFHLLRINDFKKSMIKVTLHKIMEWTGKSLRSVKKFISSLSVVFKLFIQKKICYIDCLYGFEHRKKGEVNARNRHLIEYRLKKAKTTATEQDIKDTLIVLKQYKVNTFDKIIMLLDRVILNFGTLMPRYLNKLASQN